MTKTEILETLKKQGINNYEAMVATSCESAYDRFTKKQQQKISYDDFCDLCNDLWLDNEGSQGLTTIADCVVDHYKEYKTLPESVMDIDEFLPF